ncbi:predicted protein [Lichtheimia corymbifera JMRC:FSU:9682]|uniref:Uncharacterized protein n=1 Tax=Lichtheimia corymbifera JMRC:FSU:9682 TaxID=1263082 RepID=A0A068S268_9FUNG|nr:predicted protein [Lichtheimia corymbifera JMRC:FSU:9682]
MCVVVARTPTISFRERRSRRRARNSEDEEGLNGPQDAGMQGSQQRDVAISMHRMGDHSNNNDTSSTSYPPPTYQESRKDSLVLPTTR